MSEKNFWGEVFAYIPPAPRQDKGQYRRIGSAFTDDQGRLSIRIDTLPLPGSRWEGWLNIFDQKTQNRGEEF